MTATTNYITEQEYLDYIKSSADIGNPIVQAAIAAASRSCDAYCGRVFYQQPNSTMYFSGGASLAAYWYLDIEDLATTSGLSVHLDTNQDGTYVTALTLNTDFILEPINQQYGGILGWPYMALRARRSILFPIRYFPWQPETVKIVGTFGWPTVPDPVKQATKIVASQLVKLADAPLGVAGWGAYGDIKVKEIPQASLLLAPYRRGDMSYAIA